MKPFEVNVPDAVLDDLKVRLGLARFPNEPQDAGWRWGANLGYMRELVDYWRNEYDWRTAEAQTSHEDDASSSL